jgi:DNA-binding GntR family transcriptional regulator
MAQNLDDSAFKMQEAGCSAVRTDLDSDAMDSTANALSRDRGGPVRPVQRSLLRDQVRLELIDRIVRGILLPGDRLNEVLLAEELEISRTPLKEAILAMEREGFVQASRTRGHVVAPLSEREVDETYPMMMAYETLIVRRYPVGTATVSRLEEINGQLAASKREQDHRRLDDEFHGTIAASCPNERLVEALSTLALVVRRYEARYGRQAYDVNQSVAHHQTIIEALRGGDIDLEVGAIEHHWEDARRRLLSAMRDDPPAQASSFRPLRSSSSATT